MARKLSQKTLDELSVLRQILEPSVYQDFKARAKEWSILKKLRKKYEPIDFWKRVRPAIPLDSLTYFYGFGAEALDQEWKEYVTVLATQKMEENRELDFNIERLEREIMEQESKNNRLDIEQNKGTISTRKQSLLEWAE